MVSIGNYELSDADFKFLTEAIGKFISHYGVDRTSVSDINFLRKAKVLNNKLKRKKPTVNQTSKTKQP